jgi:hypothetical protein
LAIRGPVGRPFWSRSFIDIWFSNFDFFEIIAGANCRLKRPSVVAFQQQPCRIFSTARSKLQLPLFSHKPCAIANNQTKRSQRSIDGLNADVTFLTQILALSPVCVSGELRTSQDEKFTTI